MLHLDLDLGYISSLGLKKAYLIKLMDTDIQSHPAPLTMYQVVYKILFSLTHKFGKDESKYNATSNEIAFDEVAYSVFVSIKVTLSL